MAQAVAQNATGISQGVVNSQLTARPLTTRTRSVAVKDLDRREFLEARRRASQRGDSVEPHTLIRALINWRKRCALLA